MLHCSAIILFIILLFEYLSTPFPLCEFYYQTLVAHSSARKNVDIKNKNASTICRAKVLGSIMPHKYSAWQQATSLSLRLNRDLSASLAEQMISVEMA